MNTTIIPDITSSDRTLNSLDSSKRKRANTDASDVDAADSNLKRLRVNEVAIGIIGTSGNNVVAINEPMSNQVLITPEMDYQTRCIIINALRDIPVADRDALVAQALRLITPEMSAIERVLIVKSLRDVTAADLDVVVAQVLQLITPEMSADSIIQIIIAIRNVPAADCEAVLPYTIQLLPPGMRAANQIVQINNAVRDVPVADRDAVVTQVCRLYRTEMGADGIAKAVNAVRDVPAADRHVLVAQALLLNRPRMKTERTIEILIAIRNVPGADCEAVLPYVLFLINPEMHTAGEIVRIIIAMRDVSAADRNDVAAHAFRLIAPGMSVDEIVQIINALRDVPAADRNDVVSQALRLIIRGNSRAAGSAERMSADEMVQIITAVRDAPTADRNDVVTQVLRLLMPGMRGKHRSSIIKALREVSGADRKDLVTQVFQLIIRRLIKSKISVELTTDIIVQTINALKGVSVADQEVMVTKVFQLGRSEMSVDELVQSLTVVRNLSTADCDALFAHVFQLLGPGMCAADEIIQIINAIRDVPAADRKAVVTEALRLIAPEMRADGRVQIINAVRDTSAADLKAVVTQALRLIAPEMRADGRVQIINAVRDTSAADLEAVVTQALRLIPPGLGAHGRQRIVAFVRGLPAVSRDTAITRLRQRLASLLDSSKIPIITINPNDLFNKEKEPAQPHVSLIALYNFIKNKDIIPGLFPASFPRIKYNNSPASDVGGVTRNFVTQVMKAVCHPDQNIWKIVTTENGCMPSITSGTTLSESDQIVCCKAIGVIFSNAIASSSVVTGNNFHFALYKMIHSLNEEEIVNFDNTLQAPSELSLCQKYQNLTNLVMQDIYPYLLENVSDNNSVDRHVLEDYVTPIIQATLLIAQTLRARLPLSSWNEIKGESPEKLKERIEGKFSKEAVITAFGESLYESMQGAFMEQWINKSHIDMVKKLVFTMTGSEILTSSQTLKINVVTNLGGAFMHTCFGKMDIYPCPTYEEFKMVLEASLVSPFDTETLNKA
ncbi:MAG: hypothetical protein KGI80_02215 [Verrucomicrobiota bacterium]|nr:hypothetical protein [Verrucomicrobiota bacterium]